MARRLLFRVTKEGAQPPGSCRVWRCGTHSPSWCLGGGGSRGDTPDPQTLCEALSHLCHLCPQRVPKCPGS